MLMRGACARRGGSARRQVGAGLLNLAIDFGIVQLRQQLPVHDTVTHVDLEFGQVAVRARVHHCFF
jgi:hypothetical protein